MHQDQFPVTEIEIVTVIGIGTEKEIGIVTVTETEIFTQGDKDLPLVHEIPNQKRKNLKNRAGTVEAIVTAAVALVEIARIATVAVGQLSLDQVLTGPHTIDNLVLKLIHLIQGDLLQRPQ